MISNKILSVFFHPVILSVIPALIIICILPLQHEKFVLEQVSLIKQPPGTHIFFDDIDQDGFSERIFLMQRQQRTSFIIHQSGGAAYNQWNLRGELDFGFRHAFYLSGDYNQDGTRELFFFTLSGDSILMHVLSDLHANDLFLKNRFISLVGQGMPTPDPFVFDAEMEDLDGDGKKELIFGVGAGFSLYPRKVFAYFIDQDSLVFSPSSSYNIFDMVQADITGDGRREMILHGMASANVGSEEARYHDHHCWLMVLGQDLNFLFDPVPVPEKFESFRPVVVYENETPFIVGIKHNTQGSLPATFYKFDNRGWRVDSVVAEGTTVSHEWIVWEDEMSAHAVTTEQMDLVLYNEKLEQTDVMPGMGFTRFLLSDIDNDGKKELIGINRDITKMHVFRRGFKSPVSVDIDWAENQYIGIQAVRRGDTPAQIALQAGLNFYLYDYGFNPMYYAKFGIYLLVYLGVLIFTVITRSVHKRRYQQKQLIEKKITELQIKLVKNQLDPHFTLNAINALIQGVRSGQPEIAEDGLLRFAAIYRGMLLSANKVRHRLDEELSFTENYLALEKLRLAGAFKHHIEIENGLDQSILIPKMLILVHAENAVKHALAFRKTGGLLQIEVRQTQNHLHLIITDNGPGRAMPPKGENGSTGMGLKLMQALYDLYYKFYNQQISSYIRELKSDGGEPLGTRVYVKMSIQNEFKIS